MIKSNLYRMCPKSAPLAVILNRIEHAAEMLVGTEVRSRVTGDTYPIDDMKTCLSELETQLTLLRASHAAYEVDMANLKRKGVVE